MKKKWIVVLTGILFFGIGYLMLTISPDPMEENLELARQAANPQEAAAAISANNKKDVFSSTAAYFLVGLGFAMTGYGIFMSGKKETSEDNM
ncbi:hypothetical protein [Selenomonas sp. oral taxon 138]|uniref:hypothetical protein n=1 Tax=Selenomonas sp. oral taxon 138 TaxID=712532 RepID=UPI0002A37E90|nr:hypothetical protein [Selenomonas sp. oral taxon 138]EKX99279.1 hypothetical protein HMPREF9163_00739 [Selenomonas sp. oral taxon 138 str. F0429]